MRVNLKNCIGLMGFTIALSTSNSYAGKRSLSSDLPITRDDIYFGSLPVKLSKVPGKTIPFIPSEWAESSTPDDLAKTLNRTKRQLQPGHSIADVVVPAIPALDLVCKRHDGPSTDLTGIEEALRTPLIKIPNSTPDTGNELFHGVASGARSALLKRPSGWYRLKGCGNYDQGFPVRTNHFRAGKTGDGTWRDIRGSAFPHTALRELDMTSKVSSLLSHDGIVGCNSAVGMAIYDEPHLPMGHDFPTACIIEKTLGDRRFGTHVLAGLELILPLLVDEKNIDPEKFKSVFPANRPGVRTGHLSEIATTGELMSDYSLGTSQAGNNHGDQGFTWPKVPRDQTTLSDMTIPTYALPEKAPYTPGSHFPKQWTREGEKEMDPKWRDAWIKASHDLQSSLRELQEKGHSRLLTSASASETLTSSVLAYLYSRTGYDAGRIMGGMHKHHISWGTYQDEMCRRDLDEWHCNAHANNLVIIPEGSIPEGTAGSESILSYLDLDMAFDDSTFVDMEHGRVGLPREEFDRLLWKENVNLMEVLAGSDSSTGVPQVAHKIVHAQSQTIKSVKSSLYDTLILSYLRGYTGDTSFPLMHYDPALKKAAHAIIRLAIIIMADYAA